MDPQVPDRSHLCDSHGEEVASLVTHALGLVFSICSLTFMLIQSLGDSWKLIAAAIFGGSLVLLYASSTLYHIATTTQWKRRFQALDHACIYLLIAGSYTPFTLITLRGPWGWSLLAAVWTLALVGVLIKTFGQGKKDHWLSTALYLVMGWLIVIAIAPLCRELSSAGLAWLVAGGIAYSLGIVFFAWNRLPYNHAIWHLFVLTGSICHVLAVSLHVLQ